MKKIGILGGTFNPIHTGHLILAQQAAQEYGLLKILILPSGISYMKSDIHMPGKEIRADMVKLAIASDPLLEFCGIELDREGNTYTCDTCDELRKLYPDTELYFIIGADTLFSMERWKNIAHVFECFHILAAIRDDASKASMLQKAEELKRKYGAAVHMLHTPNLEISSSEIRRMSAMGKSIRYFVPEKVYDYIKERDLYHDYDECKEATECAAQKTEKES